MRPTGSLWGSFHDKHKHCRWPGVDSVLHVAPRATAKRKRDRFGDSYMEYWEQRQGRRHVYNHRARRLPINSEKEFQLSIIFRRTDRFQFLRNVVDFWRFPRIYTVLPPLLSRRPSLFYIFYRQQSSGHTCTFPTTTPPGGWDDLPFAPDDDEQDSKCNFFCTYRSINTTCATLLICFGHSTTYVQTGSVHVRQKYRARLVNARRYLPTDLIRLKCCLSFLSRLSDGRHTHSFRV